MLDWTACTNWTKLSRSNLQLYLRLLWAYSFVRQYAIILQNRQGYQDTGYPYNRSVYLIYGRGDPWYGPHSSYKSDWLCWYRLYSILVSFIYIARPGIAIRVQYCTVRQVSVSVGCGLRSDIISPLHFACSRLTSHREWLNVSSTTRNAEHRLGQLMPKT